MEVIVLPSIFLMIEYPFLKCYLHLSSLTCYGEKKETIFFAQVSETLKEIADRTGHPVFD